MILFSINYIVRLIFFVFKIEMFGIETFNNSTFSEELYKTSALFEDLNKTYHLSL